MTAAEVAAVLKADGVHLETGQHVEAGELVWPKWYWDELLKPRVSIPFRVRLRDGGIGEFDDFVERVLPERRNRDQMQQKSRRC
jgi:hypothetical protein